MLRDNCFQCRLLHYYNQTSYLSNVFSEIENTSLSDYITNMKINKTKDLLLNTDMKIYEISEIMGYKKKDTFHKVFKTCVGCTPAEFRNKSRSSDDEY